MKECAAAREKHKSIECSLKNKSAQMIVNCDQKKMLNDHSNILDMKTGLNCACSL